MNYLMNSKMFGHELKIHLTPKLNVNQQGEIIQALFKMINGLEKKADDILASEVHGVGPYNDLSLGNYGTVRVNQLIDSIREWIQTQLNSSFIKLLLNDDSKMKAIKQSLQNLQTVNKDIGLARYTILELMSRGLGTTGVVDAQALIKCGRGPRVDSIKLQQNQIVIRFRCMF